EGGNMKITYTGQNGYVVETGIANIVFDFCGGVLPAMAKDLPLLVFVSHGQALHFDPVIFSFVSEYPNVQFFLSHDILLTEEVQKQYGITRSVMRKISFLPEGVRRVIPLKGENGKNDYIILETIKTCREGIAWLLNIAGKRIYYAGDMNWWVWENDSRQVFNQRTARFKHYMETLYDREIYLAFANFVSAQEKYSRLGIDYLLNTADVANVVPMGFGLDTEAVLTYRQERCTKGLPADAEVIVLTSPGESKILL
ncbi:MAG: hypothetical protein LUC95_13075, partial [Lachnospiraceae bacterium]|nr:hypothetical protein [Lachnospiraceae bacterium]